VYEIYAKGGSNFYGFSASGKNDQAGDPTIESLVDKAKAETDIPKRQALALDLQRYMAQKQYHVMWPGGAGSFLMAWPAVGNFQNFRFPTGNGVNMAPASSYWIDDTKPPFKKA
jgi:hypothetical protein